MSKSPLFLLPLSSGFVFYPAVGAVFMSLSTMVVAVNYKLLRINKSQVNRTL